jgi:hypothetical protein
MWLLLTFACDLQVASEDTVLYTLQKYLKSIRCPAEKSVAKQRLASLVRSQHLSQFWLTTLVVSEKADYLGLSSLEALLLLRSSKPAGSQVEPSEAAKLVPDAPASWALAQRTSKPVSSVSMTWNLDVSTVRKAVQLSMSSKRTVSEYSPNSTAPMGGLTFSFYAQCSAADGGCKIGMFATSTMCPLAATIPSALSSPQEGCTIRGPRAR